MGLKQATIFLLLLLLFCTPGCNNDNSSFDPRDSFVGSYYCEVNYNNTLDPDHELYQKDTTYHTTLDISKHDNPAIMQITGGTTTKIELDPTNYSFIGAEFDGQRLSGKFFSDSIYIYSYMTPAAIISWTYYGKKITN